MLSHDRRSTERSVLCDIIIQYRLSGANAATLRAVCAHPTPRNVEWRRIESLLIALGARRIEGRGSRVRFVLGRVVATFHRPHPAKEAKPYQLKDVRHFLVAAEIVPPNP